MSTGTEESHVEAYARTRIGTWLRGKYRLDDLIGVGGMAVVYRATHRNQAEFAVKMLHPELSIREDVRTRFIREGYAANSVKHPGVVLVVDDDVAEDGSAFIVMELLDGEPCDGVWEKRGGRLDPSAAQRLGEHAVGADERTAHRVHDPVDIADDGGDQRLEPGQQRLLGR